MTPEKLAELRRLHEAATPGEWVFQREYDGRRTICIMRSIEGMPCVNTSVESSMANLLTAHKNAEWIATAHNEWNVLLDEIERLRGALERIARDVDSKERPIILSAAAMRAEAREALGK